ncbi:hypothetical protein EYF80_008320 [Liparis tanakae]|uniref:Uncharacterized protein n=1 Tax=Liparis tanakae TaxID=230148 RepID=A0A4Z2IVJ8_9TELE|nr:hypothetical protein EYF80_008320 [Liparis tanakae]
MSPSPLHYHHKVSQGAPGSSEAAVGPEEKGKGLMGRWGQGPGMGMGSGGRAVGEQTACGNQEVLKVKRVGVSALCEESTNTSEPLRGGASPEETHETFRDPWELRESTGRE